ncbi:hypothetical protein BaRGS_00029801 [Batillaria attramentaria]|uniref:Uncharacterized protein n=1 Tax=Batillaria attramentaria TaxID=370345 RepID=A0ABD0JW32_9CAEN
MVIAESAMGSTRSKRVASVPAGDAYETQTLTPCGFLEPREYTVATHLTFYWALAQSLPNECDRQVVS